MSGDTRTIDIKMPQLAESVVNATISKWLIKPGEPVDEYEPICEVITDKVTAELPSTEAGTMGEILVEEGQTVDVGAVICTMQIAAGDDSLTAAPATPASRESSRRERRSQTVNVDENAGKQPMSRRYSPAVRTLAEEHEVELSDIQGTGLGGRVTRKDVLAYIEQAKQAPQQMRQNVESTPVRTTGLHLNPGTPKSFEVPDVHPSEQNEYYIDVDPVRNTIASRMRQSVAEIPHAWTMIEVDVTDLVVLRNKLKEDFMKQEGVNLTYLSFIIKAVVSAIKDYPMLNSVWAVDKIIVKRDINISLAVGTEDAVYTPVIKQADQKNIAGIAREIDSLTKRARGGKLSPNDMQNGTFTVNNTGSFGSILSQPIISYPQAANLTFESIVKKPVVIDDMIAVRSMVNICLSLDHRILDGVICGRFLQRVKENIESYGPDTQLY